MSAEHRHEVRVAAPARHDVQVAVVGDPGAGDAADVPADVEALGREDGPQRLDRLRPRAGGSRAPRRRRGRRTPSRAGTARPGGDQRRTGTCSGARRRARRGGRRAPARRRRAAARQKMHSPPSSACWTYSSLHGAHRRFMRRRLLARLSGLPCSIARMTNWLKRLFGGSGSSESDAPEPATAPEPASTPAAPPPRASGRERTQRGGARGRRARLAEAQSHFFQRKKPSMPTTVTAIRPRLAEKPSHVSKPGKCTFIPKKPVRKRQRQHHDAEDREHVEDVVLLVRDQRLVRVLERFDDFLVVVEQVPDALARVDDVVEVELELLRQERARSAARAAAASAAAACMILR